MKGDPDNRGDFKVVSISTGTGSVYPYRIRTADQFGNPTSTVVNIESEAILKQNVSGSNGVLPVAALPTTPVLPDGNPGNHFLNFQFSHKLLDDSIISNLLADQTNAGLTGALTVLAYDPSTETTLPVQGRGFVNGYTYYNEGGVLRKVLAVEADGADIRVLDARAAGFPSFAGAADLVGKKSFVFIADSDNDLTTIETFPANRLLRLIVTNAVRDSENDILEQEVGVATTVGPDTLAPEVLRYTTPAPDIVPGNNQTGVDPTGSIRVRFNKPVQPGEVGTFFDPNLFTPPTGGVSITVTAQAQQFPVIYYADPISYGNLMEYLVRPAYSLPGNSRVDIGVQTTTITSLSGLLIGTQILTSFTTGEGPGIVNAPVAPECIYVGIGGAQSGVSVIDLNGFGQGTGDLSTTRFPIHVQTQLGSGAVPAYAPGNSTLNAGGAGVLTLTQDTTGSTRLLREPIVGDVTDIHIGAPLDLIYNNENINLNATRSNQFNELMSQAQGGNTITQPPVPNPPSLVFPPPNPNRAIFGEEPVVKSSTGPPGALVTSGPPNCIAVGLNKLVRGNPFSTVANEVGVYGTTFMGVFVGPQRQPGNPPPPTPFCPFTSRQQVGHFLYVLDRDNRQVVVVNSNRFTVLDTIQLSDPVSMAMSPNMTRLAVTNFASATVSFIDIDPTSSRFHEVVAETRVEDGPTAVAWQPDGEDVLVVSTDANFLTVIQALDFKVRRTVGGFLNQPIDIVCTERYLATGNQSNLYYAYILNSNGTVAVYESGPDGVNGIGFNDVIGNASVTTFPRAKAMHYDHSAARGGVLIGHVDSFGLGQVSRLSLTSTPQGPQPLSPITGFGALPPTFRQKEWAVVQTIGGQVSGFGNLMSGNSVIDLCVDDLVNNGGLPGQFNTQGPNYASTPYIHSGKHTLKQGNAKASFPRLLFVALSDVGAVDVFELQTGTRISSISVPGVRVVSNYWRQ